MQLKPPEQLNVSFKGARGLAYSSEAYVLRPELMAVELKSGNELQPGVELKPGEETEILVSIPLSKLPANANVKVATATLKVYESQEQSSAGAEQTTVGIAKGNASEETYNLRVEMPKRPRNVEIKLEQGEVFWTRGGMLGEASYELPSFAEPLNAYLDRVQPTGDSIPLRFLVKSDTPGKVEIIPNDQELDYSLLQTQIWQNLLDGTIRVDRNLVLDFNTIAKIPLDPISKPSGQNFALEKIGMDIGGELSRERLLGSIEVHDGREFATISNDYSLAQSFEVDIPIRLVGVSAFFQTDSATELYLEIQNDLNGLFPAAASPLAKSNLSLAPMENSENPPWTFANLETPVELEANKPYWIVIKGIQGKAQLGLQDQKGLYLRQVLINRGGQLWKSFSRTTNLKLKALVGLIYLPEIDNQTAAIEIGLEGAQGFQPFAPTPKAQAFALDVKDTNAQKAVMVIKSHARGSLSIANVIQEYKSVLKSIHSSIN